MDNKVIFQQGNNNITKFKDGRVLKTLQPNSPACFELPYSKQMEQWNKYYAGTPYANAFITEDGQLSTPYIQGDYPSDKQRLAIIESMIQKGFAMVDCRDKRNFIVNQEGVVFPVDFGQIYTPESRLYKIHLKIVEGELSSIRSRLKNPPQGKLFDLNPAQNAFQNVGAYLLELEQYKKTLVKDRTNPIAQNKVTHIDLFIQDTRDRVAKYNAGEKNAFDGYIEKNKPSLQILAQNRTTRPLLYSIMLSLMIVPIIAGVIQFALTKGNAYLYLTNVKASEGQALKIQDEISDTIRPGKTK